MHGFNRGRLRPACGFAERLPNAHRSPFAVEPRGVLAGVKALETTLAPASGPKRDWERYARHRDCQREEREAAASRLWRREADDVAREGLPEQHEAKTLLSATDTFDAAVAQWQAGKLWTKGVER